MCTPQHTRMRHWRGNTPAAAHLSPCAPTVLSSTHQRARDLAVYSATVCTAASVVHQHLLPPPARPQSSARQSPLHYCACLTLPQPNVTGSCCCLRAGLLAAAGVLLLPLLTRGGLPARTGLDLGKAFRPVLSPGGARCQRTLQACHSTHSSPLIRHQAAAVGRLRVVPASLLQAEHHSPGSRPRASERSQLARVSSAVPGVSRPRAAAGHTAGPQ